MLQFASGAIDSWILFWGSYVGAIIGSIAVYVVAKIQIKKQHEQQIEEIKSESEHLYQRDIEGYLLRNKIDKLDAMVKVADELYLRLKDIEKDVYPMMETLLLDSIDDLNISDEEKEGKYDFFFENITENNKQSNLLLRKLRTLSSYLPEMKEDLNEIETLLQEVDRDINIVFNVENGYRRFMSMSYPNITLEIPSLPSLHKKLPEFIVYKLRAELQKNLHEVKVLAGEHLVLTKEDGT